VRLRPLLQYAVLRVLCGMHAWVGIIVSTLFLSPFWPDFCFIFYLLYSNGQFIVAGSDDGSFFIWDKTTTNIVRVLRGDESIVNCLEPHPETCLLATSGIDPVVRLWSPLAEVRNQEFPQ